MFFFENWPTFKTKKTKNFVIDHKPFPLARMKKMQFQWTKRLLSFESVSEKFFKNWFPLAEIRFF